MEKFKNTMSASQLDKINSKANQLVIDITPWTINERIQQKLSSIRKAIEDRKEITFEYSDSMSNRTTRNVEPYSLVLKAQKWYLYAWCLVREDFRFFKLSRIKDLAVTVKAFIPKEISMEEQPWDKEWQNPVKTVTLDLIFEKEFETIAEEWFGEDVITNENGSITVSVTLPENNWLYGFLLSFGPGVEVISPLHIRENLRKFAQEIVEKYSK
jgi:predicted DNA-binding transcriptional regulator YafY